MLGDSAKFRGSQSEVCKLFVWISFSSAIFLHVIWLQHLDEPLHDVPWLEWCLKWCPDERDAYHSVLFREEPLLMIFYWHDLHKAWLAAWDSKAKNDN